MSEVDCINDWIFFVDSHGDIHTLALIQYSFDRYEHSIDMTPHGNSKGKRPFSRTKSSVIDSLKVSAETKPPRKVIREIENKKGGVMGADSACDLPRNRKQVKNLKYNLKHDSSTCKDVLARIMHECKESSQSDNVFIRAVEAAPESVF